MPIEKAAVIDDRYVCPRRRAYSAAIAAQPFDEMPASRILTLSEPTSVAGGGSNQSEGHSGDQTKDRTMSSAQAEDQ